MYFKIVSTGTLKFKYLNSDRHALSYNVNNLFRRYCELRLLNLLSFSYHRPGYIRLTVGPALGGLDCSSHAGIVQIGNFTHIKFLCRCAHMCHHDEFLHRAASGKFEI